MESLYTKGPDHVPDGLTKPSSSFKKHIAIALLGLVLFVVLYFVLTIWFARLAINLFIGDGNLWTYLLGIGFAFLSLFMAKSIFFLNKREENPLIKYITPDQEPVLFDFLYKLADDAGAPRPHKVFLSNRVNASVSYDLSILNLIFPSKKNLEIGLGLVNTLNLGEFKAVLAHEFGHFAQRSMLLGRYVYVAQQIAASIINKRDVFDKLLAGISSFDIRIAWIGWILSILVWAIRALIETCFSIVVIAEKALSREMEFQADLVAVSMTGSDALIHALYKLQIADAAYDSTLSFINDQLERNKAIPNLYTLQSNYIENMAMILGKPEYGKSPEINAEKPESHRIFSSRAYNPPQMWATHPADKDREDNAKKRYIPATIDGRASKDLFVDILKYELELTEALIKTAGVETELLNEKESIDVQNKDQFSWTFLNPKYNSCYLNRHSFINFEKIDDLYDKDMDSLSLTNAFNDIYPKELSSKIKQLEEINEEIEALTIRQSETLTVEKRIIWHRGNRIKRNDIDEVLQALALERETIVQDLMLHDRTCRSAHYEAAKKMEGKWAPYLKQLGHLLHYTEHSLVNLDDAARKFNNVLNIVIADGKVTDSEMNDLLIAANDLYKPLRKIYEQSEKIKLNPALLKKLKIDAYREAVEEFKLGRPERETIKGWVDVIDGWYKVARKSLVKLHNAGLEHLLDTEAIVLKCFLANQSMTNESLDPIETIDEYPILTPGKERKIQRKLKFWDRFYVGDGIVASTAKFSVSGAIILGALLLGKYSQKSEVYVFNGLATNVIVTIEDNNVPLGPDEYKMISIDSNKKLTIETTTDDGELIENVKVDYDTHSGSYIYNVANAAVFMEYPVFYGYDGTGRETMLGAQQWFSSKADYILKEAPSSISTSSGGVRKDVLAGYANTVIPSNLIGIVSDENEQRHLIASHIKWDASDSPYIIEWLNYSDDLDVIQERLNRFPDEVMSIRAMQNSADSIQRIELCAKQVEKAKQQPENANAYYLSCRCIDDEAKKDTAFITGYEQWENNPWLAYAAAYVYAQQDRWTDSYNAYTKTIQNNSALLSTVALDVERIKRMLDYEGIETSIDDSFSNDQVTYYRKMEKGTIEGGKRDPDYVYYLLNEGKLKDAYTFIDKFPDVKSYVLRLLAASTGVDQNVKTEAEALSDEEGINFNTLWIALAEKYIAKKDIDPFLTLLESSGLDKNMIIDFLKASERHNITEAESLIKQFDVNIRSRFYLMGSLILKETTPEKWKTYTSNILFSNERPYL